MVVAKKQINLLSLSDFEESSVGKIFFWFLRVGRFIVIGTELIVIIAFILRFKFDMDLVNLNEEIQQKQTSLASFGDLEKKVRFLQKRITIAKKLQSSQLPTDKILNLISGFIPSDVYLDTLSVEQGQFSAKAFGLSQTGIAVFVQSLQKSNKFDQINLTSIKTHGPSNPKIEFTIQAKIK